MEDTKGAPAPTVVLSPKKPDQLPNITLWGRQVGVAYKRRDPDDPGKITHMLAVPCEPGRIIERGGRKYMIMRDGSQRRVAMENVKKHKFGK